MNYMSVCSGIEAATVAWEPLGWKPLWYSEIEKFPCAVLKHHYPDVPNLGDMTEIDGDKYHGRADVLVGGTPCQSFSVAGLRGGMDDPRGNLALVYLRLVDQIRPRWFVWENVPGVLSSNRGRDFGAFLGGLVELGYGFAYRVLDAQYFGVPQRRRRVFVVGYPGDWRRPAAVLFESESLHRDTAKSKEKRTRVTALTSNGVGTCGADDNQAQGGHLIAAHTTGSGTWAEGAGTLRAREQESHEHLIAGTLNGCGKAAGSATLQDAESGLLVAGTVSAKWSKGTGSPAGDECQNLIGFIPGIGENAGGHGAKPEQSPTLRAASNNTTPAVAFGCKNAAQDAGEVSPCLRVQDRAACAIPINDKATRNKGGGDTRNNDGAGNGLGVGSPGDPSPTITAGDKHAVAFEPRYYTRGQGGCSGDDVSPALQASATGASDKAPHIAAGMVVRRLTPIECERLQGFPDDFTRIPYNKKPADKCPDGPRYKALGNSMAVPVMRWIGERIQKVNEDLE